MQMQMRLGGPASPKNPNQPRALSVRLAVKLARYIARDALVCDYQTRLDAAQAIQCWDDDARYRRWAMTVIAQDAVNHAKKPR